MEQRHIGQSGLQVTPLCFGTSSLGDMPETYGYEVSERQAIDTILKILDGPVNFLDTSNNYGFGRSEERIGKAIREYGGLPEGFVLATKLDREMATGRFDKARVRQSFEESLGRLGLDQVPLLHFHDPEHARDLEEITCEGGAIEELFKLKEEGLAKAVGLAMGRIDIMFPLLKSYDFDALISHNRYSLLNRSAGEMFDYAAEKNIAILNAAPFAGGVLAKGSTVMPRVTYQDANEEKLAPVKALEAICANHNVPTGAAALQFSMKDPRITSTLIGITRPERIDQTLAWATLDIPDAVWQQIMGLGYETGDPEADRVYNPG